MYKTFNRKERKEFKAEGRKVFPSIGSALRP
jgi:hypothetical protein